MNLWSKFPISQASEQEVGALRDKFMWTAFGSFHVKNILVRYLIYR